MNRVVLELAARRNCAAAEVGGSFLRADATRLPLPRASVNAICANPPWGNRVGSSAANRGLYPGLLSAATAIAAPGARLVILSHEIRLMQSLVSELAGWQLESQRSLTYRGHHPRMWVLSRA